MDCQRLREIISEGIYWESIVYSVLKKCVLQKESESTKNLNGRTTELEEPESIKS